MPIIAALICESGARSPEAPTEPWQGTSGSRPLSCVERAQSTWRYEFYASWDLPHRIDKLQTFVDAFAHRFNHSRPHQALGDLTPAEYLKTLSSGDPDASQMN